MYTNFEYFKKVCMLIAKYDTSACDALGMTLNEQSQEEFIGDLKDLFYKNKFNNKRQQSKRKGVIHDT